MKYMILSYGAVAGFVVIATIIIGMTFLDGADFPEWLGFLVMLLGLSLVFVGIKRYRDQEQGGVISFGKAALLGLGIAFVAGVVYVAVWEVYLAVTDYAFIDDYTQAVIAERRAAGVTEEQIDALVSEMERMKEQYASPVLRPLITFVEIFPLGLLVTLISAAVLRKSTVLPASG